MSYKMLDPKTGYMEQVLALKEKYRDYWRDDPESYWFARLVEEVGELGGSLVGNHTDSPGWELAQIAAICLNWLEMREEKGEC